MKPTLLITILASFATSSLVATESPKVGSPAPDFSLADARGKMHSISQNKGKFVVLEWFNPVCPFVKKHYSSGNMQKL
jgi:peroxiredoxin